MSMYMVMVMTVNVMMPRRAATTEHGHGTRVEVRYALACLVEKEIVQRPDGGWFVVGERVLHRTVPEHEALGERHLPVYQGPHVRAPDRRDQWCRGCHATRGGRVRCGGAAVGRCRRDGGGRSR